MSISPVAAQTCVQTSDLASLSATDARAALRRAVAITSPTRPSSDLFRSFSSIQPVCADSLALVSVWGNAPSERAWKVLPVTAVTYWNSAYPRTVNDGASWRGAGLNFEATGGAEFRWRFLRGAVAPEFAYNANADHPATMSTLPDRSRFASPYHLGIDYPKRMGADPVTSITSGQSYIQAELGPVAATFSAENIWIGAAQVYPILLSSTAPGFPHLRIGTTRARNIAGVFNAEFQLFFASLRESEYFDSIGGNDSHFFMTAMVTVEPRFLPGLYLSVARADHDTANATGQGLGFYLERIFESPFGGSGNSGNRFEGNAIGLILVRWVLPESGFEAYAEWSKEDTPGGLEDLLREPDWTQAYVLGFQKAFKTQQRLTRVYGELIHLGESAPVRAGRGLFSYYTHGTVIQGHTNRGQLLGAAIGPGSDAQLIGVD
ncbi:MAG TPA: capsule assembly Wzi family protein, partial [Longimicrobiales bacterium]